MTPIIRAQILLTIPILTGKALALTSPPEGHNYRTARFDTIYESINHSQDNHTATDLVPLASPPDAVGSDIMAVNRMMKWGSI